MEPTINDLQYNERVNGIYVIHHVKTRKTFVGYSAYPGRRVQKHYMYLRNNNHPSVVFQSAYNDSNDMYHVYFLTKTKEEAFNLRDGLIIEYTKQKRSFNKPPIHTSQLELNEELEIIDNNTIYHHPGITEKNNESFLPINENLHLMLDGTDDLEINAHNVKFGERHCGVYILHPIGSDLVYVGSSSNLYRRLIHHRNKLKFNNHPNIKFQEEFNVYPTLEFISFYCESIEKAIDLEQALIDTNWSRGNLLNLAPDARNSLKLISYKGVKLSPERIRNIVAGNRERHLKRRKHVSINGVIYEGVREAAVKLNMNYSTVQRFLNYTTPEFKDWFYINQE